MTGRCRKQLLALSFQMQKPLLVAEAFVFVAPASRRLSRGRLVTRTRRLLYFQEDDRQGVERQGLDQHQSKNQRELYTRARCRVAGQ